MKIRGAVLSGLGKGSYYVSLEPYRKFFEKLLGKSIFCGTLNVCLQDGTWSDLPLKLYNPPNNFSPVYYVRARVFSEEVILVRPVKSRHPQNVIEIVASSNLRKKYRLKDGDVIEIEVNT